MELSAKRVTKQRKGKTRRSKTSSAEGSSASTGQVTVTPLPEWLTRSSVYKKVPDVIRVRLDEAILLRPTNCVTLEQIADKFELADLYGISVSVLRSYARKMEQFVRPAAASQLMASLLGCLSEEYRQRLVAGGQVLLLSRVVQALSSEGGAELSVAELAKLASVLSAVGGRSRLPAGRTKATPKAGSSLAEESTQEPATDEPDLMPSTGDSAKLAEAVRMLYGLPWPPDEHRSD